ncbi:MAG TPA: VWA domain-containing protein [Acidimicrobiales bacterium]
MTFAHPGRLGLLVVVPLLAVAYAAGQVRRRRAAAAFAMAPMLSRVAPRRAGWWRHAVAAAFLAVTTVAVAGAAQPSVAGETTKERATVIVAIDVSDSMAATDVEPDRITAATAAARAFVRDLPNGFEVGLVTAGASPSVLVAPTSDRQLVEAALRRLELSPGTALGEAIFTALAAVPTDEPESGRGAGATTEPSSTIVLLSDGETTTGRPDSEAVEAAVEAGVPVSTIAFGTDDATVVSQGQTVSVPVNRAALRAIAEVTGGQFFAAATTNELRSVYDEIDAHLTVAPARVDVAHWFAGAALLLLVIASVVALVTTSRAAWA